MRTVTIPSGGGISLCRTPASASFMYAIHIGSAALAPVSRFPSGRNSSNPIQAVATRPGLNPENQASY